jgi:hypothetical protein
MEYIRISSMQIMYICGAKQTRLNNTGTQLDISVEDYLGINTKRITYTSKPL